MKKSCTEFLAPVCCSTKTKKPKTLTSKQQLGKYANNQYVQYKQISFSIKYKLCFVERRNDLISGLSDLLANNCDSSFYSDSNRHCYTLCLRHCVPVRTISIQVQRNKQRDLYFIKTNGRRRETGDDQGKIQLDRN